MSKALIPLLLAGILLAGSFTSCKKHITDPPDDTSHHCDTCCDTCKKDTNTKPPCDTCNLNKDSLQRVRDSLAHVFTWTEYIGKIPNETNLTGVWVFGPNDIIIVANSLWHFDGTNFTVIPAFDQTHNGVTLNGAMSGYSIFAFSKTDYWLVHGSDVLHTTDGKNFDDYRPGSSNACWGSAPNDVFVVGNGGQIHHFDGVNFTQMTSGSTKDLRSVWGTSSSNVWGGGLNRSTGATVLVHYDGANWTEIDLSKLGQFGCANCDAVSSVWAIDSSGNHKLAYVGGSFFYRNADNGSWTNDGDNVGNKLSGGGYAGLSSIRGNSATDILCTSDWGFASHWNGKTWKRYDEIYAPQNPFYLTNSMSFYQNTACIVGVKGGQGWMALGKRK